MKILDLYKSILATAGMITTSDGFVKMKLADKTKPATIKGKSLVLPTDEQLKSPDWSNRVVFHPLFENIMRPESEVLALYRQAANIRVNVTVGTLAAFLMRLATSPSEHGKLSPDQSEFLSLLKNADDKTMQALKKLMEAAPVSQPQKSFVHIYLKKTGSVAGKRFARVGVVTFPVYAELKKAEKTHEVFGVKLRVKDIETLLALFEYIFPGIGETESYNRGSNSDVAPSIDVMMKTIAAIADPLNALLELMGNVMDDDDLQDLVFQNDWMETFENLAVMLPQIRAIPMQAGNDGAVKAEPTPVASVATPPQPQFQPAPVPAVQTYPVQAMQPGQQWQPPPMQQSRPAVTSAGMDLNAFLQARSAPQPMMPVQPMGMVPMGYPQPMPVAYQQQQYQQPVYQQPPVMYPPQQGGFNRL